MKITSIETIRIAQFPQLLWVQLQTSEGLTGLGETFFSPTSVEAYIHDDLAAKLIDRDPLAMDAIARDLVSYVGFRSTGVEGRAASAIDIALWDIFGKATNQPIVQLPGGLDSSADPHLQHLRRLTIHAACRDAIQQQLGNGERFNPNRSNRLQRPE